jgi:hypothetical protein
MLLGSNTAVGVSSAKFGFPDGFDGEEFKKSGDAGADFSAAGALSADGLTKLNAINTYLRGAVAGAIDGATIGGHIQAKI